MLFKMERLRSLMKVATTYPRCRSVKLWQKRNVTTTSALQYKWEPDNLKLEPDIPEYDSLLVKLQGYDYRVLESFQQFVYSKANTMGINCNKYSVPSKKTAFQILQFNSSIVKDKIELSYCERVVQLRDVPTIKVPILLDLICPHTPEGVNITVKENTPEDEQYIFVPNQDKKKILEMIEMNEEQRA